MQPRAANRIGTLREQPLHASVKRWYARAGDQVEVPVDEFVIDLVRGRLLIEVQTRSFSAMKAKVASLLARGHRLRIVHPIAIDRWIVQVDAEGTVLSRRRSPRHGRVSDIASELVSFPGLLAHPRFEVEVLMTSEEEYRRHVPGRNWRRGGWSVVERRLLEVVDRVTLARVDDLARLLPGGLPERFTSADLAQCMARPRRVAQQLAYCLRTIGVIDAVGKRSHAVEYRVVRALPPPSSA